MRRSHNEDSKFSFVLFTCDSEGSKSDGRHREGNSQHVLVGLMSQTLQRETPCVHACLRVKVYGESVCEKHEKQGLILSKVECGFILQCAIVPRIKYWLRSKKKSSLVLEDSSHLYNFPLFEKAQH